MKWIERYVQQVGRRLPRKGRADIEAELRSTLVDTLESGTPGQPTEEDELAMLQAFGPPYEVARAYQGDRYLIGPELFPFFRMVLGIVLVVLASVQLVLLGVLVVFTPGYVPEPTWVLEFLGSLVTAFGYVVVVFAILQHFGVRASIEDDAWDPRSLPEPEAEQALQPRALVVEMILSLLLVVILLFLPDILGRIFAGEGSYVINPVLQSNLPLVIVGILLGIGLNIVLLWKGAWTTLTRWAKIGVNLFEMLVLLVLLIGHNQWLAAYDNQGLFSIFSTLPAAGTMPLESAQALTMWAFRLAFFVALVVLSIETVRLLIFAVRRLFLPEKTAIAAALPPDVKA
jgi:hypothetical protein